MISSINIAWLAGILEGEGSFGLTNNGRNPVIQIGMTDKDVILRVRDLVDQSKSINISRDQRKETYKEMFRFNINGSLAIGWMMTLYSYMSIRRKAKIKEVLNIWKSVTLNKSQSRNMRKSDKFIRNLMLAGLTKERALEKYLEIRAIVEKI